MLVWCAAANATTWDEVTVACPVCRTQAAHTIPGSTFIPDVSPDFRPLGIGVDMTSASLVMCPKCGFTASYDRFGKAEGLDANKVKATLVTLKTTRLFRRLDRAIAVERNWSNDPVLTARLTLAAKWLADDTGETALIKKRVLDAVEAHKTALDSGKLEDKDNGAVTYLIGELYRQAGDQKQALEWFSKAEKLADGRLVHMIQEQSFLVRYGDKQPKDLLSIVAKGKDGEKLAAIRYLRDSNDPAVITFLKDFCLAGPEDVREPAISALLSYEPRTVHLPIYLEGLRNKHFRTVQYSAMGVERLGASEAAPIITEVMNNPVRRDGVPPSGGTGRPGHGEATRLPRRPSGQEDGAQPGFQRLSENAVGQGDNLYPADDREGPPRWPPTATTNHAWRTQLRSVCRFWRSCPTSPRWIPMTARPFSRSAS